MKTEIYRNVWFLAVPLLVVTMSNFVLSATHRDAAIASPLELNEETIFSIYDQINTADIEMSYLVVQKGYAQAVLGLGEMIVRDHVPIRSRARALAKKLGITLRPTQPIDFLRHHSTTMRHLETKSGAEFDRAYLRYEIKFSEKAIQMVRDVLLPKIQNVEFRAQVEKDLVGMELHLSHVVHVAKELDYTTNGPVPPKGHAH